MARRNDTQDHVRHASAIHDSKISFIDLLSHVLDLSEQEFKEHSTAIYFVDDNSIPKLYQLLDFILNDPRGRPLFRCWIEDQAVDIVSSKVHNEMEHYYRMLTPPYIVVLATQLFCSYQASTSQPHLPCFYGLMVHHGRRSKPWHFAYLSLLSTFLKTLALQCLGQATQVALGPHILCYDNMNISTSIFVK
ncbi:hypothetical protein BS17DRAFT_595597 [Gyrodon lividus]|nr:hypothetical protein BS17DRAFT_595597 [Gyrodon lividus]